MSEETSQTAHCYFHSQKEAGQTCRLCHKAICKACTIPVEGEPFCQICWEQFTIPSASSLSEDRKEGSIPWQQWRELGVTKAFWNTAGQVVFQPGLFFSKLSNRPDPGPRAILNLAAPLLFAAICVILFWFPMNVFYIKYIFPPILESFSQEIAEQPAAESHRSTLELSQTLSEKLNTISFYEIMYMPVNFLISYIILSSLLQQALIFLFHGRAGYEATFQIRCYAMVVQCLWLIPFLGIFLAEIGSLLLCTRGFQVAQNLPLPKALFVAAVPAMMSFLFLPLFFS